MDRRPLLLVEDDRDIRESLVEALEREGHLVVGASDGLEALERLRDGPPPKVILVDLMMPRMCGTQFCRELGKVPEWSILPVVILTADAHAEDKARALGAVGFLRKPFKIEHLLDVLARTM